MIGLGTVIPDAKIINFEDDGEGIYKADLVFNAYYIIAIFPQVHAGRSTISAKTFMFYKPIEIREKLKIYSFPSEAPIHKTIPIAFWNSFITEEFKNYNFKVILGRAKQNVEALMEYNQYPNIEVRYDVQNMPEIMTSCDIAFTSRGRTGYELAILGIPSISMAQNHREEKHSFVCNENGFTYIGLNPPDEIVESNLKMYITMSKEARQRFPAMLLSHDLHNGRKRVMNLINSLWGKMTHYVFYTRKRRK